MTLVHICCSSIAQGLLEGHPHDLPNRLADLPEEEHAAEVLRIWKLLHYLKESNRRMQAQFSGAPCVSGQHHYSMYSRPQWRRQQLQQRQQQQEQAAADLAALYHELYILSAFAKSWWRPTTLCLHLPSASAWAVSQLGLCASSLTHLEIVDARRMTSLAWLTQAPQATPHPAAPPLAPPPATQSHLVTGLRCLGLRGCTAFDAAQLGVLPQLQGLRALDLGRCTQLQDDRQLASVLVCMPGLQVVNLSETGAGDYLLASLTWRNRAERWARGAQQAVPSDALAFSKCAIHSWQLAGCSRLSPAGLSVLTSLDQLTFLDVRRCSGLRRGDLRPLESAFPALHLVQGSVLSANLALAAAAINDAGFLCACIPTPASSTGSSTTSGGLARTTGSGATAAQQRHGNTNSSSSATLSSWVMHEVAQLVEAATKYEQLWVSMNQLAQPARSQFPLERGCRGR